MRSTPAFPADFAEYLTSHGWVLEHARRDGYTIFSKKNRVLMVNGDTVDLLIQQPDPGPARPSLVLLHSFTGWSAIGFFAWTLLMHVFDAITLQSFLTKVKKEVTGNIRPFEDLLNHFRIADHKGIPESY